MVEAGWVKSIKAALLGGLVVLSGFVAEAKDVYYVSGYFGTAGDGQHMTIVDADGASVAFPIPATDTLVIRNPECKVTEAWVSDDASQVPRLIRVETDFTFHSGVSNSVFSGVTMEIAENVTATFSKGKSQYEIQVGTVVFEGDGTVDLSGAASISDPLTLTAGTKFKLPDNYTGGIVITDSENINPADYSDYVIYVDANGKTQLMPKKDVVAYVGAIPYRTLRSAFDAAKPSGEIVMAAWPTTNLPEGIKDSVQWQGTVQFSGTMPAGFTPANYGNASSTIELKGVSGGHLEYSINSFDGTLKVTNDGMTPGWSIGNGVSMANFVFGALIGEGTIVDVNSGVKQQYSFKDASNFGGSIKNAESPNGKRFIIGKSVHGSDSAQTGRIVVEEGYTVRVAEGQTLSGRWGMLVYGTVKGSGTLACTGSKMVYFGCGPNSEPKGDGATIDLSDGVPTVDSSCGVTFGNTLTLMNVQPGDTILKCSSKPTNLDTVTLKDESGATPSLWSLKYEDGVVKLSGDVKKLSGNESWEVDEATANNFPTPLVLDLTEYYGEGGSKPVGETAHTVITFPAGTVASDYLSKIQVVYPTLHAAGSLSAEENKIFFTFGHLDLYWNAWRGTFWEAVFGGDIHGNKGFGRTESGTAQAILAGDTVIFDKTHYQVAGVFAEQSPYWHYDENLYIKDEVNPGVNNDWDLKVLEGVTLKMGLRGARTEGQNIIKDFKIYVEGGSTLELGYWGNTHHYQGVIRPDVTFGGLGTITLGDDMGASCHIEGDLKTKGGETPTLDVRGKELVVQGGTIDVNLTGFGALSGSGTITTQIAFTNATINATSSPGFTFTEQVTIEGVLTAMVSELPAEGGRVKILTASNVDLSKMSRVVLVKDGHTSPISYTAELVDGVLYAKIDNRFSASLQADARAGYDWKTFIVVAKLAQPIEGVVIEVTTTRPIPSGDSSVSGEVTQNAWKGMTDSDGIAHVLVGSPDEMLNCGAYTWTATAEGLPNTHVSGSWEIPFDKDALAEVDGRPYLKMQDAVAASKESGKTIKLLTNVFFAPPPGEYAIEEGYDILITNDMLLRSRKSTSIHVVPPKTVDHYQIWTGYPFVIEGNWLGVALPWKTQKKIKSALGEVSSKNGLKPFEAYVLGLPADTWDTAQLIAYGVQTNNPNTIELTDNLPTKDAAETGVIVTKKLVDANDCETVVSATTTYDLSTMGGKSELLKLGYSFSVDEGQQ